MNIESKLFRKLHNFFDNGLSIVEYLGLLVIAFATTYAMYNETLIIIKNGGASLTDLLLMFLFLEVLAMIGQYFRSGKLPVRYPLYIAIVAVARYLILDIKEVSEIRMIAVSATILLLALAVLIIRYGHVHYPYNSEPAHKPYVKE